jgi:intracellular multiplication protein IcmE
MDNKENSGSQDEIVNELPIETKEKKKIHPGMKKNLWVIGGVMFTAIVATAGSLMFVFGEQKVNAEKSNITMDSGMTERGGPNRQYVKLATDKNEEDQAKAQAAGKTFLPVIIDKPVDVAINKDGAGTNTIQVAGTPGADMQTNAQSQNLQVRDERVKTPELGVYAEQLKQLMKDWSPPRGGQVSTIFIQDKTDSSDSNSSKRNELNQGLVDSSATAKNANTKPLNYEKNLLHAFPATLDKPIRTDIAPLAIVTLAAGPYAGAKLKGETVRVSSFMKIEFTDMYFNNQHYSVKAIALDSTMLSEAITGEYDRELINRHALPLVFDAAYAYADARSQTGQSAIASFGGVATTIPAPTNDQAIASGIKAALKTGKTIANEDMVIPHVSNPANTTIAVLFIQ